MPAHAARGPAGRRGGPPAASSELISLGALAGVDRGDHGLSPDGAHPRLLFVISTVESSVWAIPQKPATIRMGHNRLLPSGLTGNTPGLRRTELGNTITGPAP